MFERDLILAIWESLVIFPSFDTFFLILELATQFIFKARSKPENLWKSNIYAYIFHRYLCKEGRIATK